MRLNIPDFQTKGELFDYLIANKRDLVDLKKSETKYADECGGLFVKSLAIIKAVTTSTDTDSEISRTIVGNTYNWMDSHSDVHLDNTFSTSIQQKGDRVRHFHDHVQQLSARVGIPIKVYEEKMNWSDLGVNKVGQTMVLLMDSRIKRAMNAMIFEDYKDGNIDQHSVGMRYDQIELAVNNPDSKEEYATWNKYIGFLGNPEKAQEKGYFWAVKKAQLLEISCVLEGSNELTPMVSPSQNSTPKADPPQSSQPTKTIFDYLN